MTASTFISELFGAAREHWVRSTLLVLFVVYVALMGVTGHLSSASHSSGPRCFSADECANDYQNSLP